MGERRDACKILAEEPEEKRPFGRNGRSLDDNIRMDLGEIGWKFVEWMHLSQDREQWRAVVNTVMNLWVP
jgi:hypothetical protein